MQNNKLRNVAIIAHVDHGKTTLVDEMLKQGGVYRENQEVVDRVMDSNDLERERGITILAKNTAIHYGDTKINIVDTPGHADFGGEVERILKMVNGVILLVDAAEGPMPQTRFVLSRALELGHRVIVVVNKIDRPDQRIHEVVDEVLELLLDLDATPEQLDSPMLFCSGRNGTASYSPDEPGTDLKPLFDTILNYIPAPEADVDQPFQMLVSAIDYNEFVGRMAIGRIERGALKQNQEIMVCNYHDPDAAPKKAKAVSLYEFDGLGKKPVTESTAGNIICLSGIGDITIGDTICAPECVEALPFVKISAPTMEMTFSINDSPFAGRDGKFVTSRQIRERLMRETLKDVSLRVSDIPDSTDSFNVAGRGEMSLSILIETMRREGFELSVGRPEVTVDSASEAEGATLTVKVAVKPEVKVGSYNGLTVEKTVHTVTDEAVDAELKRVQERNARELTREGAAQNGDIADIDFEGFVDGVAFEGGKAEHYNLTLGSGSFIPGFEEQVVGHSAGEEFDVNVTFPTEYQAAELAGKAAVFKIKLHEVKYKELPALDDELAKDCSEYDTLDEFKASIRKNNQEQLDKQDDLAVENALVDQVIESMEGEIPQAMYDVRMDEMVNDFAFRVEQQGLRLEDYLKYMGQSMEQFRAAFMPQAEKQVKIGLALEAVAAAEHIEASEDEINAEIKRIADQYKMEEDKVRELVNLEDLKQDLARTKAIDFIKSHANIVVKPAEAEKAADAE